MTQYKFKGKRVDNGQWVYGSLVNNLWVKSELTDKPGQPTCEIIALPDGYYDSWEHIIENYIFEVIPETVGISLCLPDKNDKEIYEGDIVEGHMGWLKGDGYLRKGFPHSIRKRMEVVFNHKGWQAGFELKDIGIHPDDIEARKNYFYRSINYELRECREAELKDNEVVWLGKCTTLEVVGNKFDNPELYNL